MHPHKTYRYLYMVLMAAGFSTLYFSPVMPDEQKAFVFFAALAVLMEFWEVQLPKLPRILVVETVYIAGLFLFTVPQELILVAVGALGRLAYSLHATLEDEFKLMRRLVLYGSSALLFARIPLRESFGAIKEMSLFEQIRHVAPGLGVFVGWTLAYSVAQFMLIQFEKMIRRRSANISIHWFSFGCAILFNLLILSPLGLLMFILYELSPRPFPYALTLLIPPLLVIYRSIRNYTESLEAAKATIEALAEAVDKRLVFTVSHSPKVARIARNIAMAMGLSDEEVELVERAARIHDLGKVGIADKILNKKEPLTDEEFKMIKKHPEIGARVASQLSLYEQEVEIIRSHHEHFDGSGYPEGAKGEKIPLGSRIIAVADGFESAICDRPYRKGVTIPEAVEEVKRGSGTKFDPKIVEAFLRTIEKERTAAVGLNSTVAG